jgi:hypothetical protein
MAEEDTCCVDETYFAAIYIYPDLSARTPDAVCGDDGLICRSYNDYGFGWEDLVDIYGWDGQMMLYSKGFTNPLNPCFETISVSVSNSTFAFSTNPLNTWLTPQTSVITNDGTVAENFVGSISQFTDGPNTWGISSSANGDDMVRAQWSTTSETGPWTDISAYDTDFTIATNVAGNDSVNFWFRIQTPTSTSSYNEHSSTLTVTAQEY